MHGAFSNGGGGRREGRRGRILFLEEPRSVSCAESLPLVPPECPTLFAPRREHSISRDSLDNSLRRSLVPALSLSFFFLLSVFVARASRFGGSQARIHVHTQRRGKPVYSRFPPLASLVVPVSRAPLVCLFLVATTDETSVIIIQPTWPTRVLLFLFLFFCIQLGCSVSTLSRVH